MIVSKRISHTGLSRKLNIGCGAHLHGDWCNIDMVRHGRRVICHDIRTGLPFQDNWFEMVYHSHVLEHLTPEDGEQLIRECYRVLQPGGILRIVVPDLEKITQLYLQSMRKAWGGDREAEQDYEWMKLELLDQLVRHQSGGQMGRYMTDERRDNLKFVKSRVGTEFDTCQAVTGRPAAGALRMGPSPWRQRMGNMRAMVAGWLVRGLLGPGKGGALQEGLFRQQGEIHRWMYDRLSLKRLCQACGFRDFRVCAADESLIPEFPVYQLDAVNGQVRKPDSLFVECRKYAVAARRAA